MSQLTNFEKLPTTNFYNEVLRNKNNPAGIFRATGELIESASQGKIGFIDPTNPVVFLAESTAVAVSAVVDENVSNLRRTYPSLAETVQDLYPHMSDEDHINRFATPAQEPISVLIGWTALRRDMVRDEAEQCFKAVLPRETVFRAGNIPFLLQYPVVIRYFDTGSLEISYDNTISSPFQTLTTNVISYEVVTAPSGESLIHFKLPLYQMDVAASYDTIQPTKVLTLRHVFTDQFYYARAFYRNASTDGWVEMKTTHTEWVYDRRDPTLLLTVEDGAVVGTLPLIYTTEGGLTGDLRLQVYTTRGSITESLSSFDFTVALRPIDEERDLTSFTTVSLRNTTIQALSSGTVTGGKDALTFEELRQRVIYNTIGPQNIPITSVELVAELENNGFEVVKNTDVTTNRVFLAMQDLPTPSNERLISAANIGVSSFITDKLALQNHPHIKLNGERWTITPDCLFIDNGGVVSLLPFSEVTDIEAMEITAKLRKLNANRYLYTPFYWVLDNADAEFSSRPYHLDGPSVSLINFIRQNPTLQLAVNTRAITATKVSDGYQLLVETVSGNFYKELPDGMVSCQLMFRPDGEGGLPVYLLGTLIGRSEAGERIFQFNLRTSYDIDTDDQIEILGVSIQGELVQDVRCPLVQELNIFHCTSSLTTNFQSDASGDLIGRFQLPENTQPITHEAVTLTMGSALKNLWARARPLTTSRDYKRYETNVQAQYAADVYRRDPDTGSIITIVDGVPQAPVVLHAKGELVFDENGEPVWAFLAGQPMRDLNTGELLFEEAINEPRELDILFVDGRHYFVTDQAYLDYNKELVQILLSWITEDLAQVAARLIDQSKIYFHPRSQLGYVTMDVGDGIEVRESSEQSPVVNLYVPQRVMEDPSIRLRLEELTVRTLDTALKGTVINNSLIEDALRVVYGTTVTSFNLQAMGSNKNIYYGKMTSSDSRLSVKRILIRQADGTLIMKEDVTVNFFLAR